MPIGAALAEVLRAGRNVFNARVAEARSRVAGFDADAFGRFVETGLDPIAHAVATYDASRTAAVTVAAYDIAIELVAHGLAGLSARRDEVDLAWARTLPACAAHLTADAVGTLALITNAVIHLQSFPGARPAEWVQRMTELGPRAATQAELRLLGQVLAWRAGMAHFRDGALAAADQLPPALALAATGAPANADWPTVLKRFRANRWYVPDPAEASRATAGLEVGAFTGFGGAFTLPPVVRLAREGFLLRSGGRYSLLVADAFGATLHGASEAEWNAADGLGAPADVQLRNGQLVDGKRRIAIGLPSEGAVVAGDAQTVVLASRYSYRVRVIPRG